VSIVDTFTLGDTPLSLLQNEALPDHPIADDRGMLLGGTGSDLWLGPNDPVDEFWMVADRGPNGQIEVDGKNRRTFPVPDFTPLILHARARDGALTVLEAIPVVNQQGEPATGLSNIEDSDEKPYDYTARQELDLNQDGIDPEGLVRTSAGDFSLADEYRRSLLKVDATSRVVARYVPEGVELAEAGYPVGDTLPAIYATRKQNRGFDGLALSGDERTLYAVLQSPLSNPDQDAGEASRAGRILAVGVATGEPVSEYLYWFEDWQEFDPEAENEQDEVKLSGVVWLDAATLLALERTDAVARLYTVDFAAATDILGGEWDDPATSPTLEEVSDPSEAGIEPLAKTLLVDLEALDGMPDKIEGVAVVDGETIAVANDNDFDVNEFDADGRHIPTGKTSHLLLVRTPPIPGLAAGLSGDTAAAAEPEIEISGFAFGPFRIEIAVGATVTWTNFDGAAHTDTADGGGFDSGRLDRGQAFARDFATPGAVLYVCRYHKDMTGIVDVS
jgi:plastocyanin